MAKPLKPGETNFAKESKRLTDEQKEGRNYLATEAEWDKSGEEYGGQSDILLLDIGEMAGPLTYIGHQQMTTELGETTVHTATNINGEALRLPIQATFLRAVDQASLSRGDTIMVKRCDDVIKKRGKGAGNPMSIYAIKVVGRAPRESVAL